MGITRRQLQVSLAALWLLDGVLQCQPFMFSARFARRVLGPARGGLPTVLADVLHGITALVSMHPALANGGFAFIQLALGIGLLSRRFARPFLAGSLAWSLLVWVIGEGLGGLATGETLLSGAPGGAILYAVIAVLAWPMNNASGDDRPSWLAIPAWCTLWLAGAALQLFSGNNSPRSFTVMLRGAQSGAPQWIAAIDGHLARVSIPGWVPALVIALSVLVAVWALVPGATRQLSFGVGAIIALTGWLLFQGLGDLTSGQATDPNTGPLIVLLAVAGASATNRRVLADQTPVEVPTPMIAEFVSSDSGTRHYAFGAIPSFGHEPALNAESSIDAGGRGR